jgi:hypothetical protein
MDRNRIQAVRAARQMQCRLLKEMRDGKAHLALEFKSFEHLVRAKFGLSLAEAEAMIEQASGSKPAQTG